MQHHLKTPDQIQAMRDGGQILAQILNELKHHVRAGQTGIDIDHWVRKKITDYGATATYLTSGIGFPAAICVSVNEELVHSIPKDNLFEPGDKVSFDLTITYHGMCVDSAFTMLIDEEPKSALKHLLAATKNSLYDGIATVRAGSTTGNIGAAVEKTLDRAKLGIIRDYVGHGIGTTMHMPPDIPNFGRPNTGVTLQAGDTICIEPMATLGKEKTHILEDGWTVAMADRAICAHFEHTVLVTDTSYEILTELKP